MVVISFIHVTGFDGWLSLHQLLLDLCNFVIHFLDLIFLMFVERLSIMNEPFIIYVWQEMTCQVAKLWNVIVDWLFNILVLLFFKFAQPVFQSIDILNFGKMHPPVTLLCDGSHIFFQSDIVLRNLCTFLLCLFHIFSKIRQLF